MRAVTSLLHCTQSALTIMSIHRYVAVNSLAVLTSNFPFCDVSCLILFDRGPRLRHVSLIRHLVVHKCAGMMQVMAMDVAECYGSSASILKHMGGHHVPLEQDQLQEICNFLSASSAGEHEAL